MSKGKTIREVLREAFQHDYDLEQDEFYGDLYVIKREENPAEELDRSINNVQNILAEETNGTVEIQN